MSSSEPSKSAPNPSDSNTSQQPTTKPLSTPNTSSNNTNNGIAMPPLLKNLFQTFPLHVLPSEPLPQRASQHSSHRSKRHALYIFTTPEDALNHLPSFNPTCLKHQTLLSFSGLDFDTIPSNNHASPSGALPFLIPRGESRAIYGAELKAFARREGNGGVSASEEDEESRMYDALLSGPIRLAYLSTLYLNPVTFKRVTSELYITPSSTSGLVRLAQSYPLRSAALSEILKSTAGASVNTSWSMEVEGQASLQDADRAFEALSQRLGEERWFGGDEPGELDAGVFAYTDVVLKYLDDEELKGIVAGRENLVEHCERIRRVYFAGGD